MEQGRVAARGGGWHHLRGLGPEQAPQRDRRYHRGGAYGGCIGEQGRTLEEVAVSEADCIFCRIVRGEIDAEVVHDEDDVLAFEDINSKAPVHVLIIPRQHVANLEEIGALPDTVVKRLFEVASTVAEKLGVRDGGYAVMINNGRDP